MLPNCVGHTFSPAFNCARWKWVAGVGRTVGEYGALLSIGLQIAFEIGKRLKTTVVGARTNKIHGAFPVDGFPPNHDCTIEKPEEAFGNQKPSGAPCLQLVRVRNDQAAATRVALNPQIIELDLQLLVLRYLSEEAKQSHTSRT